MGHGHFSPTATRGRFKEIIEKRGHHVDIEPDTPMHQYKRRTQTIRELFTNKYKGFRECDEVISDHERILAETHHGVQLREISHPEGTHRYYYLVVVKDTEWGAIDTSGLAMQHLETYYQELRQLLIDMFGDIYNKTSAWTSTKVNTEQKA